MNSQNEVQLEKLGENLESGGIKIRSKRNKLQLPRRKERQRKTRSKDWLLNIGVMRRCALRENKKQNEEPKASVLSDKTTLLPESLVLLLL